MKKKFVVVANCQGVALARTLLECTEFSSEYEYDQIKPIQTLSKSDVEVVLAKVRSADLLIHQPIASAPGRPREFSSEFLAKQVKRGGVSISFPSLYFDGYFPHLKGLMGKKSVLNLVHDYFVAYGFAKGVSKNTVLELMGAPDLYSIEQSIGLLDSAFESLENREEKFDVDIPVSAYLRANFKSKKLFNQFNHPRRPVFSFVASRVLDILGVSSGISPDGVGYLEEISAPVYRSTYSNLGLRFSEDFDRYEGVSGELVSSEVVEGFFSSYQKSDREKIEAHIRKVKPFVPQILDPIL